MRSLRAIAALLLLVIAGIVAWERQSKPVDRHAVPRPSDVVYMTRQPRVDSAAGSARTASAYGNTGFRSHARLIEHFHKHGAEFGARTADDYLGRARALRDRPPGGNVLEAVRGDGVIARYDRATGAFLAFDSDGTIRTFFRPNQGEVYFRRQMSRAHRGGPVVP
jgi:hypothetical protein